MASWLRRSKSGRWRGNADVGRLARSRHRQRAAKWPASGHADVNCVALVRPFAQQIHLTLRTQFPNAQVLMVEHHAAHAASAYYPSPFDEATVLTLDRDGDFRSAARWRASGNQLHLEKDLYYPDSLGDLYSRVTELLGFNAGSDEHKVQWLSTADSGEQFLPLFEEIAGLERVALHQSQLLRFGSFEPGRLQRKILFALGLEDGAEIPEELRAPSSRGIATRHRKRACCAWPARPKSCAWPAAWG